MKASAALAITVLCALLIGCGPQADYDEFQALPDYGWVADSSLRFEVEISDLNARYYAELSLRNNASYAYQNIWFFRRIESKGEVLYADTVQYFLADDYGRWTGKGLGSLKTSDFPYKRKAIEFKEKGSYSFIFTQAMRTDTLSGIEDIGLRLYKQSKTDNGDQEASQ